MNALKILFKHETAAPLLALLFATGISVALVAARVAITHRTQYAVLIWNLFLAWLPLVFALMARGFFRARRWQNWQFYLLAGLWLLFYPNAPYIFTDLIHLRSGYFYHYWIDLMMVLFCALTGLVLGFVSLYLMQSLVIRMFGQLVSWLFVAGIAALGSFGIYLGRFLRFNSWDVFSDPGKVYRGIDAWADGTLASGHNTPFLALFAVFVFLTYVMLYALTQLPKNDSTSTIA